MGIEKGHFGRFTGVAISICITLVWSSLATADNRPTQIKYEPPEWIPLLKLENFRADQQRIVIRDHVVIPKALILDHGEPFAWESRSRAASRIIFEREVAGHMICHGLVNFLIHEDELKSSELQLSDVANFCELEPGSYRYRIVRTGPAMGVRRRLEGVVVVRPERSPAESEQLSRDVPAWSKSTESGVGHTGAAKGNAESIIAVMGGEPRMARGVGD
jgi:hypothetical protein